MNNDTSLNYPKAPKKRWWLTIILYLILFGINAKEVFDILFFYHSSIILLGFIPSFTAFLFLKLKSYRFKISALLYSIITLLLGLLFTTIYLCTYSIVGGGWEYVLDDPKTYSFVLFTLQMFVVIIIYRSFKLQEIKSGYDGDNGGVVL